MPDEHDSESGMSGLADEALSLISGDRRRDYGELGESFNKIAAGWSAIAGVDISPKQVALMMGWLKTVRATASNKRDSYVDMIGYAMIAYELGEIDDESC